MVMRKVTSSHHLNLAGSDEILRAQVPQHARLRMERPDKSLQLYTQALNLTKAMHGEASPNTATAMGNLATALVGRGQLVKALPLFEKALGVDRVAYGDTHPSVATDHHNIGYVQFKMGAML